MDEVAATKPKRSVLRMVAIVAGIAFVVLLVAWWTQLEAPRRTANHSIALIRAGGGRIESESSCPDWLRPLIAETFVEEYFRWVVLADVFHDRSMDGENADYLGAFRHLEVLGVHFDDDTDSSAVLAHLPRSLDLEVVHLTRSSAVPPAAVVPNIDYLIFEVPRGDMDEVRRQLSEYSSLRRMQIKFIRAEQASSLLRVLPSLIELESLHLATPDLSVADCRQIGAATALRTLYVSDFGLGEWRLGESHVSGFSDLALEEVTFVTTGVSAEAVVRVAGISSLQSFWCSARAGSQGVPSLDQLKPIEAAELIYVNEDDPLVDDVHIRPARQAGVDQPFLIKVHVLRGHANLRVDRRDH